MQVKKFEAPTIQEALETVKRELGPEAIILETKKHKRGFGLMSKGSVEVTAAVSDRAIKKKQLVDTRLPDPQKEPVRKMSAERQANFMDKYLDKHLDGAKKTQRNMLKSKDERPLREIFPKSDRKLSLETVSLLIQHEVMNLHNQRHLLLDLQNRIRSSSRQTGMEMIAEETPSSRKITATRYIDIPDQDSAKQQSTVPAARNTEALESEIKQLRKAIEELSKERSGSGAESMLKTVALDIPSLQDAFELLVVNGIERRYALSLVRKVAFELGHESARNPDLVLDQLAHEILETVQTLSPLAQVEKSKQISGELGSPAILAFVGSTGVGKTLTVAKLASEAVLKRKLKVGLVNLDSFKTTSFEQLGTYAKILNIPFRSAASLADLNAVIQDFQGFDVILIDTTGRSQRDAKSLQEIHETLKAVPSLKSYLVVSATTRDAELYDTVSRFSIFQPESLFVTKLDEASVFGSIYNVTQKVGLPISYFTTGQKIPEDIEVATGERLVSLLMDL